MTDLRQHVPRQTRDNGYGRRVTNHEVMAESYIAAYRETGEVHREDLLMLALVHAVLEQADATWSTAS